jgi:NADH-quinone oxidoreductase subunit L
MEPRTALPLLLGLATLLPLVSFFLLLAGGPKWSRRSGHGAYVATGAIVVAGLLSLIALCLWLGHHYPGETGHHGSGGHDASAWRDPRDDPHLKPWDPPRSLEDLAAGGHAGGVPPHYAGEYYTLGEFGHLRLTIGYYIDSLTVVMFCMVTLVASCIHFYSLGYMHEELYEVTDPEVRRADGSPVKRRGRYRVFFQYMSLFCFSMLGLVLAGNLAMVFVFWELVGICSYFLIGFYIERKSASNAANKAFIVNRIGDFGMIVGLMALWASLGTLTFGDTRVAGADGRVRWEPGLFRLVRSGPSHALRAPEGMVRLDARRKIARLVSEIGPDVSPEQLEAAVAEQVGKWREGSSDGGGTPLGYWLLIVGGVGVFCGCVGKSAQFPLHVWLPDAMEGPTPVSALVHSATMVAAGVYLVGRFYPVFAPEVLLVIAVTGCITLFLAATIAITATDIKRVLAYSTVSQLGYMMLALGVGGWLAGMLHLLTHAFFKSLLFLCSGSVIHAVHTNDMTEMGGLRRKMPITAYTMLVGCLAIAGISIPFVIGFSGYYSKDRILEQAYVFLQRNAAPWGTVFFWAAAGGAAITAFYMFRLWYLTFAGTPRNRRRYEHAHESPALMWVPLVILAFCATVVAWQLPESWGKLSSLSLVSLLEQARPAGLLRDTAGTLVAVVWPNEHFAHEAAQFWNVVWPVTWLATGTAVAGIVLATIMYWFGYIRPAEVRRQFEPVYQFLWHKWWFDELYDLVFVRPTLALGRLAAAVDLRWIDGVIHAVAAATRWFAHVWDLVADRTLVDGCVNGFARWCYACGLWLRGLQTGRLRQYVLFLVIGALALFVLISFFWSPTVAGW